MAKVSSACSRPALVSPTEPMEACMLNGTIIAVSCCLLQGELVGQGRGMLWKAWTTEPF